MRHPAILPGACAALLGLAISVAAWHWGSRVAGGADSYGYVTEAGLWSEGQLIVREEVIRDSPWPGALGTFAPIGFRDAGDRRDAIAPVYAPGLPLLMALLQAVFGYCAAFWVVPLCAGGAVWATFALGQRLFNRPDIALWGALLLATSPTFLFQAMSPMSDVPVTAAWLLALLLAIADRPLAAGLSAAVAVAIRPNLVLVSLALLAWLAWLDLRSPPPHARVGTRALRMGLGLMPAVIGIALFNARLYGSPFESGYGHLEDLYSWRHLWTNVSQFAAWITETDTPVLALAGVFFAAPWALPPARIRFPRALLGGFVAIVVLSYVFYLPFDAWWYLRFLLPAWPIVMVLTAGAIDAVAGRVSTAAARAVAGLVVVALASHGVAVTAARGGFGLWRGESRYVDVARFISASTDRRAVIFSWQHTGSIRFYADRLTLHFGRLDRRWLDRAVARLEASGRRPYFVLDGHEVEPFRARFAEANRLGALDWRPIAVFENPYVAIYDPANQESDRRPFVIPSTEGRSGRHCEQPAVWPPRVWIP